MDEIATVVEGHGGLSKVQITAPGVTGEMYLHGAHVTSWKPSGAAEVLFVSRDTRWESGRAIRGGVPICFPWFGPNAANPQAPAHGFVRTRAWQLASIDRDDNQGAVTISMTIDSDEETKRWWPADFRLLHRVTFGSTLRLELVVTNTGATPIRFEEALHSYHRVGGIRDARVHGLDGVRYLDKVDAGLEKVQSGDIAIVSETDRVYLDTAGDIEIVDPAHGRRMRIAKERSQATVVWNPWIEKARALADLADDEWNDFVCVETCNVGASVVELEPGQQHTMAALVTVESV